MSHTHNLQLYFMTPPHFSQCCPNIFTQFMYRIENQIMFSCAILSAHMVHKLHNKLFHFTPINTPLKQQRIFNCEC